MNEWQDMTTAPMNGTPVLVVVDGKVTSAEYDSWGYEYEGESGRWVLHVPSEYPGDNSVYPTHWMPLPSAPQ